MKQKIGQFEMLIVNHLTNVSECFVSVILSLNMLNLNLKKLKKYNFKQKSLGKFVFHKTKKNEQFANLTVNHFTTVVGKV